MRGNRTGPHRGPAGERDPSKLSLAEALRQARHTDRCPRWQRREGPRIFGCRLRGWSSAAGVPFLEREGDFGDVIYKDYQVNESPVRPRRIAETITTRRC
jgi:hypothetical protein